VNSVNRNGSLAAAATQVATGGRTWLELAYRWSVGLDDIFPELNRSTTPTTILTRDRSQGPRLNSLSIEI
jgi:hypothetical protein